MLATILALVMALGLCSVSWADGAVTLNVDPNVGESATEGEASTTFKTVQAALEKAGSGDTVKLLGDVTLGADESIIVSAGKNFTLDLNGFTISQEKKQTEGHSLLTNKGKLTIVDSSAAGTGKITYEDTGGGGNYVSNTITNQGTLTVESGTIENTCSTNTPHNGFPYAIDNHSGSSPASLTITGGTVDCKAYSAIRLFCNSTANTNSATISGGTIRGCVEYQQPIGANDKALGSLTITGGNFGHNAANMKRSLYIFSYGSERDCSGMSCQITGGDFARLVEVNGYAKDFNNTFITGGTYRNGQYKAQTFDNNPSNYVSENGTERIVKRDGNADVNYVYTVLPKSNLIDGVYLTDPSGALQNNYYVSSKEGNVWTVSYSAPHYYSYGPSISAVLNGPNKSATDYTSGDYGLIFRSTASYSGFQGVQVDGKALAKGNYTVEDNGGTEVYLKAAYLKTLAAGKHTVTILSTAGNVSMDFTIGGKTTAPQTFDAGVGIYAVTAVLSVTGMVWVGKKRH